MGLHYVFAVLLLLGVGLTGTSAAGWGYDPPHDAWADTYPSCGGQRQSPIDLRDFTPATSPIMNWAGYGTVPPSMTLKNNGHSAVLRSTGVQPRITFSNGKIFQLDSVHFHWGKNNHEGSEHTLCGVRYLLEMHAVHMRVMPNGTIIAPAEIIVLTSFFQDFLTGLIGSSACAIKSWSPGLPDSGLNKFILHFPWIILYNSTTSVPPFAWSELIPKFTGDFYWYEGSLTTPPCSEVVTFFFNRKLRAVSKLQMAFFRALLNDENAPMSGNFRDLQLRNGRQVYFVKG